MGNQMITLEEIDAIRFYQGDIRKRNTYGKIMDEENTEGFWGTKSAYQTMNCLMFSGIDNEKERIREKKAALNPELLTQPENIIAVFDNIYRAMCKSTAMTEKSGKRIVYRTDRGVSAEALKEGYTISFTSTSKINKPEDHFKEKSELTLLELVVPDEIPQLDYERILGKDNLYPEQREILLPPFLKISLVEAELTEEERKYLDADAKPPKGKYLVIVEGIPEQNDEKNTDCFLAAEPLTEERNQKAASFLDKLCHGQEVTDQESRAYCQWKNDFRRSVWEHFKKIQEEWKKDDTLENRKKELVDDIDELISEFEKKRKEYKREMEKHNQILVVASVLPICTIAISFYEPIELLMKILTVIVSAIAIVITRKIKVSAYGEKTVQRTKTIMELRALKRKIKYESNWNGVKLDQYASCFCNIMDEDTKMSLDNIKLQIDKGEEIFQNEIYS